MPGKHTFYYVTCCFCIDITVLESTIADAKTFLEANEKELEDKEGQRKGVASSSLPKDKLLWLRSEFKPVKATFDSGVKEDVIAEILQYWPNRNTAKIVESIWQNWPKGLNHRDVGPPTS